MDDFVQNTSLEEMSASMTIVRMRRHRADTTKINCPRLLTVVPNENERMKKMNITDSPNVKHSCEGM